MTLGVWQTIGTAPKDGAAVLLAGYHINHGWVQKTAKAVGDQWYSNGSTMAPEPSHWMPLPAPPSPSQPRTSALGVGV